MLSIALARPGLKSSGGVCTGRRPLPSSRMKDDSVEFPTFRSRAPWWGGDLQTLRNSIVGPPRQGASPVAGAAERLWLDLDDGTGDALAVLLERPAVARPGQPWLVLVHGLGGDETSRYMQASAHHWLARGHVVVRVNLRGAGPSRERCRFQYHAGRTGDLHAALVALAGQCPEAVGAGVVLVGYSLGGNLVLKFAGEAPRGLPLLAVASVSAPIDLAEAAFRLMAPRNRFYHWHMMRKLRREATAPGAEIEEREREAVWAARSLYEFDDRFVAARAGFANADDYYAGCSALPSLGAVEVPTLALHALDDPWIPARPYLEGNWDGRVRAVLATGGGHVGFHAAGGTTWHDDCLAHWLETEFD